MEIRKYQREKDEVKLMALLKKEGEAWSCYWQEEVSLKYKEALVNSITYVAYEGDLLCGYCRALDDQGFYLYVCDLLVDIDHRGKAIGKQLIEKLKDGYPHQNIYIMSDVDQYYLKQGYQLIGSIFEVK
ncbi:MAG: GNAT family N-acetyltransferase [Erysipelotrichaceae bacterium]|nr:GNAT family N-acetyltransferase [Erysipelotrichaceae bacterium]